MKRIVGLICTAGLLALAGCGGSSSGNDVGSGECSVGGQNATIKATMQEWYLFDDQLRDSDPLAFDDIKVFVDDMVADVIATDDCMHKTWNLLIYRSIFVVGDALYK